MDVRARLKPITAHRALASALAAFGPPGVPKLYGVLCGRVYDLGRGPEPCPQSLGTTQPAGSADHILALAAVSRRLDGLPAPRATDWLVFGEGPFDRDADGTYLPVTRSRRPSRPGWRRSQSPWVAVGRRPLPEPIARALDEAGFGPHPDGRHRVFGHLPVVPAVIVCPRCGARNRVEAPCALEAPRR